MITKQLLIDAIIGRGVYYTTAKAHSDLVVYDGNQWTESWSWRRNRLARLSINELQTLYDENTINGETETF